MEKSIRFEDTKLKEEQGFTISLTNENLINTHTIPLHFNHLFEIVLYRKVNEIAWINGNKLEAVNNSILYLPQFTVHRFLMKEGTNNYYVLQFDKSLLKKLESKLSFPDKPFFQKLSKSDFHVFWKILDWIYTRDCSTLFQEKGLSLLLQWVNDQNDNEKFSNSFNSHSEFLPLLKFLEQNEKYSLSVNDAAKICCMSRTRFFTLFKKKFQKHFNAFMIERKLEKAKYLLLRTDESVTDIAYMLDFSDASYFSKVFKTDTGLTPSKFRKTVIVQH